MDSSGLLHYRTAKLRIQRIDNITLSTEGKELLYVTPHGFIGGTGLVSAYLMQQDIMDERLEIIHHSTKPICNHAWHFQTRVGSFAKSSAASGFPIRSVRRSDDTLFALSGLEALD
ncbi:hypothetical protein CTAM01_11610 [Colletotrichum tamarilloi]|uniref:Uncharacterized protein n=1 Tax=Colletotrichum tamarilloi TaxID=1209934 RepID=A0ABQ9QXH2_9PEZI|nr:uncharacterized protein CTAM01_11610 [Colletotrichum tamarilloi]KAK1488064.1 hypothetical protein CTAM01_11610 [Colletotrichum tamarilloi]